MNNKNLKCLKKTNF